MNKGFPGRKGEGRNPEGKDVESRECPQSKEMAGRTGVPMKDFKEGNCYDQVSLLKDISRLGRGCAFISQAK